MISLSGTASPDISSLGLLHFQSCRGPCFQISARTAQQLLGTWQKNSGESTQSTQSVHQAVFVSRSLFLIPAASLLVWRGHAGCQLVRRGLHSGCKRAARAASPSEEEHVQSKVAERSLEQAASLIQAAERIVVVSGAGISTSAGIPDFRTPGTGLYAQLSAQGMKDPLSIFSLDSFLENPVPFYSLSREFLPKPRSEGGFTPTPCHLFLRLLQEKGKLQRIYTQNIDGLERLAGLQEPTLVECHGTYATCSCSSCRRAYAGNARAVLLKDETWLHCHSCGCLAKPDVVLFGESLPDWFYECSSQDFGAQARSVPDLVLVMGTSLEVAPVADIPRMVPSSVPRVLVNLELTGDFAVNVESSAPATDSKADVATEIFRTKFGLINLEDDQFSAQSKERLRQRWATDVVLLGGCDATAEALAAQLGWSARLLELVEAAERQ